MRDWDYFFSCELQKPEIKSLVKKVCYDYRNHLVYPPHDQVLNAFKFTKYQDVKAVIVGQDPYHNPNQAMGLSFSVPSETKIPPSLRNIYKEYESDLGYAIPASGDISKWGKRGVLLINSILTVKDQTAYSCNYKEYKILFADVIKYLNARKKPMVFILWGKPAQECKKYIDTSRHLVLESPHPSPLSSYRGFFDSKPFSKTNDFLKLNNIKPVNWKL